MVAICSEAMKGTVGDGAKRRRGGVSRRTMDPRE